MTPQEFLLEIDEILEFAAGTLVDPDPLEHLERWNSTAIMSFIAPVGIGSARISELQVAGSATVADLMRLAHVQTS
jgi:hypothetical protein